VGEQGWLRIASSARHATRHRTTGIPVRRVWQMNPSKSKGVRASGALVALALSSTLLLAQTPAVSRSTRSGTIDGMVTDTALVPLEGATVSIFGSTIRVVTGASGRFRISSLPAGQYIVLTTRLGFEPVSEQLQVAEADTQRVAFALVQNAARLDTVKVNAPVVATRLDEFDARHRNREATASFNRDDILKANPVDTWQMLSRVSAMRLVPTGGAGGLLAMSSRGLSVTPKGQAVPCYMSVVIDGVPMAGDTRADSSRSARLVYDLSHLPPPDAIYGIEVFAGGASIPLKYGGSSGSDKRCGLIVIWTR
jgi:hypothetical protein